MPVNVSIVKNGNHQYIRVCQSYRNEKGQPTSRVIENHGRLDLALLKDPQYVEKLRERVKQQNELEKKTKIELIAKQAIQKVCEYGSMGYRWLIDMDLAKFFDTVNHEKLLSILSKEVKDKRVLSLVHKFLRVPVAENGQTYQTTTGTPQGGCCSPVLANILLNELDHEIKRRGLRAVRYADDMVIFCKTKRSAERVLRNMIPYIEGKLLLKVNKQKTKVVEISDQDGKFLGFSFRNWKRD